MLDKIYNFICKDENKIQPDRMGLNLDIAFYHIISLLINNRKHTKEFIIYQTQLFLENLVSFVLPQYFVEFEQIELDKYCDITDEKKIIGYISLINVDYSGLDNLIYKYLILQYYLKKEGITKDEILAKY